MLKNLDEENNIDNKTNHNNITNIKDKTFKQNNSLITLPTSKIKLLNTITQ